MGGVAIMNRQPFTNSPLRFVLLLALGVGMFPMEAANAAHKCTSAERSEWFRLMSETRASKQCHKALSKSSKLGTEEWCKACRTFHDQLHHISAWIRKHPTCAADIHAGAVLRTSDDYTKVHKEACGI
jgi:hypothetical protein